MKYRIAQRWLLKLSQDEEVLPRGVQQDLKRIISNPGMRKLFRAFGPQAMPFFDLYLSIYSTAFGANPPPGGFVSNFRSASRILFRKLASEAAKNYLREVSAQLRPLLARLDMGQRTKALIFKVRDIYGEIIPLVARDRGVYLKGVPRGRLRWMFFRVMSGKEQRLEQLRKEDPDLYETIERSKKILKEIDRKIEQDITEGGMIPSRRSILGRPVIIGTDPATNEEFIFDTNGDMLTVEEYIESRRKDLAERRRQERVFPNIEDLRSLDDEELDAFTLGSVVHIALTDDKAKSRGVTRIYPVKKTLDGDLIVVEGRFKGIYVDDLINRAGRLIEGVAYDFNPRRGTPIPLETKNPDGSPNVRVTREPYVTLSHKGSLYLMVPGSRAYTARRTAMARLSQKIPSVQKIVGARKRAYLFEPKDFEAVREALHGMTLSSAAMKKIRDYFTQMAKHDMALAEENLKFYEASRIGGFKPERKFWTKQKEAMAWLESHGNSGICALDTGVGKSSLAIGIMQKMRKDGLTEEGGRFLVVAPSGARGEIPKEAHAFLEDPKSLLRLMDVMSYGEFSNAFKRDPHFADQYIAIFFDEAQALKNVGISGGSSERALAALKIRHPRKILLTASPMERSPMEVFALAAIANNVDVSTPEAMAEFKRNARKFRARFAEEVGGKIVGIKQDPIILREFKVWVKNNLFFGDKNKVEEMALPKLASRSIPVTMHPEIEAKYRSAVQGVEQVMRGMVSKYRDRSPDANDPAIEKARFELRALFTQLAKLANSPGDVIPGAENPKLDKARGLIDDAITNGSRTILFTDSPDMARESANTMSLRFPGWFHAECQSDKINIWRNGEIIQSYTRRSYTDQDGKTWEPKDWKSYVINKIIRPNHDIVTATLTNTYSVGQNLQPFSTVIHLDRDAWNAETMKQRTARAWRSGQRNSVQEYILDAVYENPETDLDATLDQIMGYLQQLESDLFDQVVKDSQEEALGKEWFEMQRRDVSFMELSRRMMELTLSPYVSRVGANE